MDDLTAKTIGGYLLQWQIGQGGMATVYLAQRIDDPDSPRVAIKVLHPSLANNQDVQRRFQREADIGQQFRHQHIVRVHERVEADGYSFMVMDYLAGGSLADRIKEQGALTWWESVDILKQVALALAYAHDKGVVHRDVKPSNILFDKYGDAYISDFGIAQTADASALTAAGFQPGTFSYMSPEQIQGDEVGPASDLFSLAVVCYQMLSDVMPFEGTNTAALTYQIVHSKPKTLPRTVHAPRKSEAVLKRAMAKDPTKRYETVLDFVDALESSESGGMRRTKPIPVGRIVAILTAIVLLVVAILYGPKVTESISDIVESLGPVPTATRLFKPTPTTIAPASATPTPTNVIDGTATPTPTQPPGATETPLETPIPPSPPGDMPTLIPTNTPTPVVISTPTRPTVAPAPPTATQPVSKTIVLVSPRSDEHVSRETTFSWSSDIQLQEYQYYELVLYPVGDNALITGFSPTGATKNTRVSVDLAAVDEHLPQLEPGEYYWGVLLVRIRPEGDYTRMRFLSGDRLLTYDRPAGSSGGGGIDED